MKSFQGYPELDWVHSLPWNRCCQITSFIVLGFSRAWLFLFTDQRMSNKEYALIQVVTDTPRLLIVLHVA